MMPESQLHEVYTLVSQVKLIKNITARPGEASQYECTAATMPYDDDCLR